MTEIYRGAGLMADFGQIVNYDGELLPTLFDSPIVIKKLTLQHMDELSGSHHDQQKGKMPDMPKSTIAPKTHEATTTETIESSPPSSDNPPPVIAGTDTLVKIPSNIPLPKPFYTAPLQLMQQQQIKFIMQQYDKDGDDQLNYKEFSDFLG